MGNVLRKKTDGVKDSDDGRMCPIDNMNYIEGEYKLGNH